MARPETPAAQSNGQRLRLGDAVERLLAAEGLLDADVSAETRPRLRALPTAGPAMALCTEPSAPDSLSP
jgi:hypothetical protein